MSEFIRGDFQSLQNFFSTTIGITILIIALTIFFIFFIVLRKISKRKRNASAIVESTDLKNTMEKLKSINYQVSELIKSYMIKIKEQEQEYVEKNLSLEHINKKIDAAKAIEEDLPKFKILFIVIGFLIGVTITIAGLFIYYYIFNKQINY